MNKTRRATLIGLAALIPASLAGAARAEVKTVEAGKMFPYLDMYLGIPAAQRTRFSISYAVKKDGKAPTGVSIVMLGLNGARTPIPLAGDGRVLRLPTLAELKGKSKVELTKPDGSKVGISLDMVARVAPATTLAAADLTAAIGQCDAAIKSKAGVLGFAAPKIKRTLFKDAGGGTAVNAQGAAKPLPMMGGHPAFDPEQMPGMVSIRLNRPPSVILMAGRPK